MGAAGAWRGLRTAVAVAALVGAAALTAVVPPAALAWVAPAVVGAAPAAGGAVAACSGVAVVVDFGSLGGGARTGCFAGDPSSGLQALSGAGFSYSFVPRQPGLVCQINAKPDPCNGAPATAYWSYWHGRPGGSWTYSSTGAGAYNPAPGGVEGWSFGAGQAPGIAPPAAAPAPPPPAPPPPAQSTTQRPPQQGAPGGPAPTTAARPGQPSATAGQPPAEAPAGSATPTVTSQEGGAASSSAGLAAGSGAQGSPEPVAAADRSPGRTLGLIAGIVLVAVLVGLTFWTARRRAKAAE